MTDYKLSDVKLTEAELAAIEDKVNEIDETRYGGKMPAHNRGVLRAALIREEKFAIWEARDYSPYDAGEPNAGDVRNY